MSSKSGIRSLVCDANGIIVAEMVYRCMICSAINEGLEDAQRHYQMEHIDDNGVEKNSSQPLMAMDSDLEDEDDLSMNFEESMYEEMDGNQVATNSVTVMNQFDNRPNKPMNFAQPSNFMMAGSPYDSPAPVKPSPKRVGGGFVTCEVCGLTKYYSHISRRYGVFSCESCAKFFYRYLLKPSKFTCANNGNCSLKIDVPGGRCKACLLQACLQKYIIDPKKHPKIFNRTPGSDGGGDGLGGLSQIPANVQIKINPKPSKVVIKPNIKKEPPISLDPTEINMNINLDDPTTVPLPPLTITPKPATNGIVIKANPGGSGKRKQQFNEDGTAVPRSRRIGCRECPGCLADDCGQCLYCLDKPKFGGNDVKKQRCIKRRCHRANFSTNP
ncbi:uncharacterized protein LOC128957486 [Oppia nitens]|uniref:uncharacterized protein LOC128957486 n=1 Tax=Oppia nitens TaxID=1686743 RepID=UPI0023D994E6|nr:uncharacterized protein LOC128957486 [Oppia nitens]